jgi:LPS-assembly lipoprotein
MPHAPRRTLLLAAPALLLSACGFELRRAPDFPFKSIAVMGGDRALAAQLRREFKAQGNLEVIPEGEPVSQAQVVCEIVKQDRGTAIAVSTAGGTVRELTLTLAITFKLRTGDNSKELIPATAISESREISYNETAALAKENEQNLLYADMASDIGHQIVRRIGTLKSL